MNHILAVYFSLTAPPRLQLLLPDMVSVGEKVIATCAMRSGSKPVTFKWSKDGVELKNDSELTVERHNDYSVFTISSATKKHMGNYTCKIENNIGKDEYTSALIIKG